MLTFILSLFLTGLMFAIWYSAKPRGFEEGQAMTIIFFIADIFQNIVLTVFTLPAFNLANPKYYTRKNKRLFYYYMGPALATLIFIVFIIKSWDHEFGFLIPSISFTIIYTYFYFKLPNPEDHRSEQESEN